MITYFEDYQLALSLAPQSAGPVLLALLIFALLASLVYLLRICKNTRVCLLRPLHFVDTRSFSFIAHFGLWHSENLAGCFSILKMLPPSYQNMPAICFRLFTWGLPNKSGNYNFSFVLGFLGVFHCIFYEAASFKMKMSSG